MTDKIQLEDIIDQDTLLNTYPWLSTHIVSRWRTKGHIRFFCGKEGKLVYPRGDIETALGREMAWRQEESQDYSNIVGSGSVKNPAELASIATGTISEPARLSEERSKRRILSKRRKS